MASLFDRSGQLLTGVDYKAIIQYPTFTHLKSIFKDGWYNFIIPKALPDKLDWDKAKQIISEQEKEGYSLTYCIKDNLLDSYLKILENKERFGSLFYMFKTVNEKQESFQGTFEEVSESTLEIHIKMALDCFPEWPTNEEYTRHFYELSKTSGNKVFKNFLYKIEGEYVGFGSVITSKELNLAYFHNMGVLEQHRRKGYFTDMVNYSCNLSLDHGSSDCYAIVEEDSGSYHGFSKLGFKSEEKYYLFDTK